MLALSTASPVILKILHQKRPSLLYVPSPIYMGKSFASNEVGFVFLIKYILSHPSSPPASFGIAVDV